MPHFRRNRPRSRVDKDKVFADDFKLLETINEHRSPVCAVAYDSEYDRVISGDSSGVILACGFKTGKRAEQILGHKGKVTALDVAPDGRFFASGSSDRTITLWRPSALSKNTTMRGHCGQVFSLKICENSQFLVSSGSDKVVKLWDVSAQTLKTKSRPRFLWSGTGHTNWVRCVDIESRIGMVCSGGDDKSIRVWDRESGDETCFFDVHRGIVRSVCFDPVQARCIVSGDDSGDVNLWDTRTPCLVQHYPTKSEGTSALSAKIHCEGNYLVVSSTDTLVRLFDLREGRELYSFQAHNDQVNSLTFSSNGEYLCTAGADKLARRWCSKSLFHKTDSSLSLDGVDFGELDEVVGGWSGRSGANVPKIPKKTFHSCIDSEDSESNNSRFDKVAPEDRCSSDKEDSESQSSDSRVSFTQTSSSVCRQDAPLPGNAKTAAQLMKCLDRRIQENALLIASLRDHVGMQKHVEI